MRTYHQPTSMLRKLFTLIFVFSGLAMAQTQYWEQANGPFGGIVSDINYYSDTGMLAVMSGPALYHSTNGGEQWEQLALPLDFDLRKAATDPSGNIWIEDFDANLQKSSDDGASWEFVTHVPGNTYGISTFLFNGSDTLLFAGRHGFYRSFDGGENWELFQAEKFFLHTYQLNNGDLAAYIYDWRSSTQQVFIYTSSDHGATWVPTTALETPQVTGFAVNGDDVFFTALFNQNNIYRSSDYGVSWEGFSQGIPAGFTIERIVCSDIPGDSNILLYGYDANFNYQFFHSSNSGESWTAGPVNFQSIRVLKMTPTGQIIAGVNSGIFKSADNAATWTEMNQGIISTSVESMVVDTNNRLHAVVYAQGILTSDDQGASWQKQFETDLFLTGLTIAPSGTMFSTIFFGDKFLRSTDQGVTWEDIIPNMPVNSTVFNMDYLPNGDLIIGGANSVQISSDDGNSWTIMSNIPNPQPGYYISYSVVTNSNGDIFLRPFTFGPEGIYRSTDGGANWQEIANDISNRVETFYIDDDGIIFAGMTVYGVPNSGPYLYKSIDNGDTWSAIDTGIQLEDEGNVTAIINVEGIYYAGTTTNVYRSINNGESWVSVKNGLAFTATTQGVNAFLVDNSGQVFASNPGFGLYRGLNALTPIDNQPPEIPGGYGLAQNYPNPFNPATTIGFQIAASEFVTLEIFSITGQLVKTLVNENRAAGNYTERWDGRNNIGQQVSSGIYFYQINAGSFRQVKKMILLK